VVISRKDILRQIITSIGATIRTAGVVKMEDCKRMAWLSIEVPSKNGTRGMVLENFRGAPCMTDYGAEENVCELAILHLMSRLNIWVKDISYDPLIETSRQLHYYMYWSQYLLTTYQELSAEKDALFNAHKSLLERLGSICVRYSDILPLASSAAATSIQSQPVTCTGAEAPELRYGGLARELTSVLQDNTIGVNLANVN
jgi:hypothetical protein